MSSFTPYPSNSIPDQVMRVDAFCDGWEDGYKEGYCYGKGFGCLEPLAPLCPLPRLGEDGYKDGYNRGFLKGQADQ